MEVVFPHTTITDSRFQHGSRPLGEKFDEGKIQGTRVVGTKYGVYGGGIGTLRGDAGRSHSYSYPDSTEYLLVLRDTAVALGDKGIRGSKSLRK